MEIVLLDDVTKVGKKGDVIRVRDGFGRNYLLPRGLGLVSTRANRQFVEEQRARSEKRKARERSEAEARVPELSKVKIQLEARVNEQGKLFGAISADAVVGELAKQGVIVERKQVGFPETIRTVGSFPVAVEIYPQVKAMVTVEVTEKS